MTSQNAGEVAKVPQAFCQRYQDIKTNKRNWTYLLCCLMSNLLRCRISYSLLTEPKTLDPGALLICFLFVCFLNPINFLLKHNKQSDLLWFTLPDLFVRYVCHFTQHSSPFSFSSLELNVIFSRLFIYNVLLLFQWDAL